MQIVVDVPSHYLDAMHRAPEDFAAEAKLAMAAKLFEIGRLSSGMAANLIGLDRVTFLEQLQRFGVPMINLSDDDLSQDDSYDRWFDAKVQASIDGIKDGTNKPYTPQEWTVRRAEIMARFGSRKAA